MEKPPLQPNLPKFLKELLNKMKEEDRSRILEKVNERRKGGEIDEEDALEWVWDAVIYDEKSTLWRLLKDRNVNPVNQAYPELSKQIQSNLLGGIEEIDPLENPKASWKLLEAYLEMRKQREGKREVLRQAQDPGREKREERRGKREAKKTAGFKTLRESFVERESDRREEVEQRELDAALASMILKAQKINEGSNGVILKVDTRDVDSDALRVLEKAGLVRAEEEAGVIKILKLYHEGEGMEEMQNQKRAYEVLEEARKQGREVAGAPKVFSAREMDLPGEDVQEWIKKMLGVSSVGKRIGCLTMEFIKGEDLALRVWKEYVKAVLNELRGRKTVLKIDEELEGVDRMGTWNEIREYLEDMQKRYGREMKQRLEFLDRAPATAEEELREARLNKRNADKIIQTLKRSGYQMDPKIYREIEETIAVLRENGIVYLDAHERNVMLTDDGVRLIDFGKCKILDRAVEGDRDREAFTTPENPSGEPVDKRVLSFLRTLITKKED